MGQHPVYIEGLSLAKCADCSCRVFVRNSNSDILGNA